MGVSLLFETPSHHFMSLHNLKVRETQLCFGKKGNHYHLIHPYAVKLFKALPLCDAFNEHFISLDYTVYLKILDPLPLSKQTWNSDLFTEVFYKSWCLMH